MASELTLPASPRISREATDRSPRGGVVVVAADEYSIGRMLTGVFSRANMKVVWPGGLIEAADWLSAHRGEASAVFVDCHQSGGEGREFCLRARAVESRLTVFLAGGMDTRDTVATMVSEGATVHVAKPYLPTEVAWQLRSMLISA
jgi:DNA-binding response OmpR family regulator